MNSPQISKPTQNPVKRTFWFGMLGVLAVAPYTLNLLVDSWSDRFFNRSVLLRRCDAVMYGYIDRVLPYLTGRVMIFVYAFCWMLALGMGIMTLYREWLTHPLSGKSRAVKWLEILGRIAAIAAVAFAGARFGLDWFYMYPAEGVALVVTSFGGALGPLALFSFPVMQLASYAFALSAMIYAAVGSRTFRAFAARSLVGIGAMLGVFLCLSSAAHYLDLGMYLDEIPGMSARPEPRTLVVMTEKPITIPIDTNFNDCSVSDAFCRKVPSSGQNAAVVRAYLEKRDYRTALRGAGLSFMALNNLRELDAVGAMSVYESALALTGDVTQGLSAVTRLVYSPVTKPYHEMLDELGDEKRFAATGRVALRLGKAYARFGELDKARYWFERGMNDLGGLEEKDMEYFRPPDKPPFCGGTVRGRLTLDGQPVVGMRVGLVRGSVAGQITHVSTDIGRKAMPFFDLQWITDGSATDADGRFVFEGLCEEGYVLLLSLKDVDGGHYVAEKGPGLISISGKEPVVDVGAVNLVLTRHLADRTAEGAE